MPLIRPFTGLRPVPSCADDLLAPPYDVLDSAEAKAQVVNRPHSFLHVSKPEIDLPDGTDVYSDAVYAKGVENLKQLINQGLLQRDPVDHYYVYRLTMGDHSQTGLVAVASVEAYNQNRIRKHEFTRPQKEQDRVNHIDALNTQTGPVFLVYRAEQRLDEILRQVTDTISEVDVTRGDGVRHEFWVVRGQAQIEEITAIVDGMTSLYIADGHHRSAAAARVAASRNAGGELASDYFLSVLFSDQAVQIFDYNRVVADLQGSTPEQLVAAVAERFELSVETEPVKPARAGEFGMYLDGQWYRLNLSVDQIPVDPVGSLDVSLLHGLLIEPLLGIDDPRVDGRIDFVGGIRGLGELERRVDSGEMAVAFSLYPTSLDALMAVADADEVMPPKSTWFEPKLADGMVSHVLEPKQG
ncbi:MAG: DUF1015 domain-containing protein [Gammaproteobacteria bacterium]|nr:MAG: DUF1015 domain-containing protein [Gammaproteobacteria bacterium]